MRLFVLTFVTPFVRFSHIYKYSRQEKINDIEVSRNGGYDERFLNTTEAESEIAFIESIYKNGNKMIQWKQLHTCINENHRLQLANQILDDTTDIPSISGFNILAGGLISDWE